jgi:L-ascorbate metabolism protein UlaG (beta-lactamase superfamily)
MLITLTILGSATLGTLLFLRHPRFGKGPTGPRLETMKKSRYYANGKFQNLSHTPDFTEGYSFWQVMSKFFFEKAPRRRPATTIPSVKTDLRALPLHEDLLVWFGHSSYYLQVHGKRMLVDPVFSGNASPLPGTNKSFPGSDQYSTDDLPDIDYLFLTHDHYDHADYETLVRIRDRCGRVFCGLGVGAHLEHWGFPPDRIIEKDWYETFSPDPGVTIHTVPTRHFSGRGFKRNTTLWLSFVLKTPDLNIYIGGDSGYDGHFRDIGERYGPFDLAILDNGQYNLMWQAIHMLPEEVLKAARDLGTKRLMPVHSAKFAMAKHPWDEPLRLITELNNQSDQPLPLVTPIIGEPVYLKNDRQVFRAWWTELA